MNSAKSFGPMTVCKCNPNTYKPSLRVFLGLIVINESGSKEWGAITLHLLLCAGVLIDDGDEKWELADNWETWRIYLFEDA